MQQADSIPTVNTAEAAKPAHSHVLPEISPQRRRRDSGAMLLAVLFMMAIMVIVAMAMAPSFVQQMKRDREEEMIHRGTEYARAIKKFYKKFGRYPANLEQLDNTNQIRFLRRRFKDPLSKDGQWKLLRAADIQALFGGAMAGPATQMVTQGGLQGLASSLTQATGQAGGVLGAGEGRVKTVAHAAVRFLLVAVQKLLVILVKLAFQHSQTVKFREQYSRRLSRGPHRILRMLVLPGEEHLMSLIEIQVVKEPKSLIQGRFWNGNIGRSCRYQQCRQTDHTRKNRLPPSSIDYIHDRVRQIAVLCLCSGRSATHLELRCLCSKSTSGTCKQFVKTHWFARFARPVSGISVRVRRHDELAKHLA